MNQLENATTEVEILSMIQEIEGPFAFVYYRASMKKIYFGRDCLGRRSLLWYRSEEEAFMLSSVGKAVTSEEDMKGVWEEVPAAGIYSIDFELNEVSEPRNSLPQACGLSIHCFPWTYNERSDKLKMLETGKLVNKQRAI
jgi:asparagine synthetase B (glutamine-hydrolysing)